MTVLQLISFLRRKILRMSYKANGAIALPPVGEDGIETAGYCPVAMDPRVLPAPVVKRFCPSCTRLVLSMLAKRTFKTICISGGGILTYMRFTTLPPVDAI